jgi:hypothetical protein
MKTKQAHELKGSRPSGVVLQMRVRCDLRAGDDLATCQMNVSKWQQRYYAAYNKAKQRGCI